MSATRRFVQATANGFLLFLFPLVVILLILRHGLGLAEKVVQPLARRFPDHPIVGVGATTLLAIVLLVLVCFLVGLFSQTAVGQRIRRRLEGAILGRVPGYTILKGMVDGAAGLEGESNASVALARLEDAWQLALVVETHEDGHRTVYVPGAPNATSGAIFYLPADRVRPVDVPVAKALKAIGRLGVGSKDLLRGRL